MAISEGPHSLSGSYGRLQGLCTAWSQSEEGELVLDSWSWGEPDRAQLHDGIDVVLVFLHFLPEADGLLQLLGVHILGPAPLDVINPTALHLKPLRVGLNREPEMRRCHRFKQSFLQTQLPG